MNVLSVDVKTSALIPLLLATGASIHLSCQILARNFMPTILCKRELFW